MRLFLAASYPEAQGGLAPLGEFVKLHLATFPDGWGDSKNPKSQFVSGTVQWEMLSKERKESMQLRILLSYWYYKDIDLDALFAKYFTEPYPDVFADSGGFSAMTQGIDIDIDEYARWIKKYKHLFSTYANLDVIGDPIKTLENQIYLEDKHGLKPLPVVHAADNYKPLEHYLSKGYPYLALGGLVPFASNSKLRMRYLIKAFQIAGDDMVFHGFGVTSWEIMSSLRWYSVDSSSWGSGFRFGVISLFDNQRGRFEKARLGDRESCLKNSRLFDALGFDWQDFADRKRNERSLICAVSALSYIKAEQFLRRKFGEVHIPNSNQYQTVTKSAKDFALT